MEKIVTVRRDSYLVKGCMNITLKNFMPCSSCGHWDGEKCLCADPEGELDMYQVISGEWDIMKFEIPTDEVLLDVLPVGKIDSIICKNCKANNPPKQERCIFCASLLNPDSIERLPAYDNRELVGCANFYVGTGKFKGNKILCHQCSESNCKFPRIDDIGFYIRKKPYGFMSNFWRSKQTIHGITYPTNEHYYQSMKAKDGKVREWIANSPKAWNSMKAGRSLRKNEIVDNWETRKVEIMLTGLRAKFSQNEDLKRKLLETGDAHIYEDSPTDIFWGGKVQGSKNMLGILLMQVRDELKGSEQ